jgi:GNAT superfamily N-acetyltransferase
MLAALARPAGRPPPWSDPHEVRIRPATPADAAGCARVLHDAQRALAARHGFAASFDAGVDARALAATLLGDPAVFGMVAEQAGRILGASFLQERDEVRTIAATAVDPARQGAGIGRRLLRATLDRAEGASGVRLVQDAADMAALALHASARFEVKAPLLLLQGLPRPPGHTPARVRPMREADIPACNDLHLAAHGFGREQALRQALAFWSPLVLERGAGIAGYITAPEAWQASHAVAETASDLTALLGAAAARRGAPVGILMPARQSEALRWCLEAGMQVVKPLLLLARGAYRVPARNWAPALLC